MLAYPPATFTTSPHFAAGLGGQYGPSPYSRHSRLQELRRVEAAIQAEIAEEEARRRHLGQRAALEFALRQQAEERRRRQEAEAEARLIAAAMARRQEQARQIALARYAQEQEYRRRVEYARQQQQQNAQLRQQLEARRQRTRQAQIAPALVQLVVDIFAAQQEEDQAKERDIKPASAAPVKVEKHVEFAADTKSPAVEKSESAEEVTPAESTAAFTTGPEVEDAVKVLQRRFRRHAARRTALEQLSLLAKDLVTRRREFEAPAELHFQSSPAASDSTLTPSSAPLAYDKSNKSFLGYEDFLVSLLSKIDAVESNGDKVVQRARKGLVAQVEKELSRLDELKQHEWERQSGASSSSSSAAASDSEDIAEEEDLVAPATETSDVVAKETDQDATPSPIPSEVLADDLAAYTDSNGVHASTVADLAASGAITTEIDPAPTSDGASASASEPTPSLTASSAAPAYDPAPAADDALAHDDSASTASSSDDEVDAVVAEVLKRAKALGEQVEALEQADRTEQTDTPSVGGGEHASSIRSSDDAPAKEVKHDASQEEVAPAEEAVRAAADEAPECETASRPADTKEIASEVEAPVQEEKLDVADKEDSKSETATEDFEML